MNYRSLYDELYMKLHGNTGKLHGGYMETTEKLHGGYLKLHEKYLKMPWKMTIGDRVVRY
ncbi:hypothetical protein LX64_00450 [Chitinophaga skermanii]|uniref:Uncharacterized protein n=1 Tax=Chitinophaga skermanii TaxID=331697 RepID=A0A327R5H2_9BACT|nr:hypothetical protein LX64_00450 [Chitinophaga skermanii]